MRHSQIEGWTLSVVDRVLEGQPIEDDRVELKSIWPAEPAKAARRVAGHLNAARGEPVLWIIGVNEGPRSVPGAPHEDAATWWPQVARWFDEIAPEPVFLNVPTGGVTVVAIFLTAERIPLVVKNPEGGSPEREVPWRVGTRVRSAKRSELVRILVPATRLPLVDVLSASLTAHRPADAAASNRATQYEIQFRMEVYLEPTTTEILVLPRYRASACVVDGEGQEVVLFDPLLSPGGMPGPSLSTFQRFGREPPPMMETISQGAGQLIVQGPGLVSLWRTLKAEERWALKADERYILRVTLGIVAAPTALRFEAALMPEGDTERSFGKWVLPTAPG